MAVYSWFSSQTTTTWLIEPGVEVGVGLGEGVGIGVRVGVGVSVGVGVGVGHFHDGRQLASPASMIVGIERATTSATPMRTARCRFMATSFGDFVWSQRGPRPREDRQFGSVHTAPGAPCQGKA